jgi:hypothetical protein
MSLILAVTALSGFPGTLMLPAEVADAAGEKNF